MVDRNGHPQNNGAIARRIAVQTIVSIMASVLLTSLMILLFFGVDGSRTATIAEVWRISLSISAIAPLLICPPIVFHMSTLVQNLRQTRDELADLARKDMLTGLLNRRGFESAAAQAFAEARRLGQSIAVLMCDLDLFKAINDKYGHHFGDIALKGVSQIIRESIGNRAAVLGRHGGEEFVISLSGVDGEEAAEIAEGLRAACAAHAFAFLDQAVRITISIGIATESPDEGELPTLLSRADAALYQAKRNGRNCVVAAATPRQDRLIASQSNAWKTSVRFRARAS